MIKGGREVVMLSFGGEEVLFCEWKLEKKWEEVVVVIVGMVDVLMNYKL